MILLTQHWFRLTVQMHNFVDSISRLAPIVIGLNIGIWVLLRLATQRIHFDAVAQQVVTRQWQLYGFEEASLGSTAYLFKLPLYFLTNNLPQSLQLFVLVATAFAMAFLSFLIVRKLYIAHNSNATLASSAAVWLSAIAGNTLWMLYPNSRNLVLAAYLFAVYVQLSIYKSGATQKLHIARSLIASFLFFADLLFAAAFLLPAAVMAVFDTSRALRVRAQELAELMLAAVAGLALRNVAISQLNLTLLEVQPTSIRTVIDSLASSLWQAAESTLRVFDADFFLLPLDANSIREFFNFLVLLGMIEAIIRGRSYFSRHEISFFVLSICGLLGLYIVSGQAQFVGTERYLMLLPLIVVAMVLKVAKSKQLARHLAAMFVFVAVVNTVLIAGAAFINREGFGGFSQKPQSFSEFVGQQPEALYFAEQTTAITTNYLMRSSATVMPVACSSNQLSLAHFGSEAATVTRHFEQEREVFIVVNGANNIVYGRRICSFDQIVEQFGEPQDVVDVPGVGQALRYIKAANSNFIE